MVKKKIFKKISNFKDKDKDNIINYYQNISRIFLLSLILIFSFFILPASVDYLKENFASNKIVINSSKQNFEDTLSEIQSIVQKLESDSLSLEKMVHYFEDGMKLMKICRAQLDEVENRISTLVKENDELSEKPGIEQS